MLKALPLAKRGPVRHALEAFGEAEVDAPQPQFESKLAQLSFGYRNIAP